jgi:hypothetical protein
MNVTEQQIVIRASGTKPPNLRTDGWWIGPLITVVVLSAFVIYGTWVALANADYFVDPYLSPFYSPCLAANCDETTWNIVGDWWRLSPALLILPFPLLFRTTCYYYRKAYYRSFAWSPPACAVPDAQSRYRGETRFPLILQNAHRYFFYLALPFPVILLWDASKAFNFDGEFGMGLGTVVLLVNAVLLGLYTLSCHSCRHLIGGGLKTLSRAPIRYRLWRVVTRLNLRHSGLAWVSLFGVALADLYVRLLANGVFTDPRFF